MMKMKIINLENHKVNQAKLDLIKVAGEDFLLIVSKAGVEFHDIMKDYFIASYNGETYKMCFSNLSIAHVLYFAMELKNGGLKIETEDTKPGLVFEEKTFKAKHLQIKLHKDGNISQVIDGYEFDNKTAKLFIDACPILVNEQQALYKLIKKEEPTLL